MAAKSSYTVYEDFVQTYHTALCQSSLDFCTMVVEFEKPVFFRTGVTVNDEKYASSKKLS
jgi:hypothetical protein